MKHRNWAIALDISVWLAVVLFVCGNVVYQGTHAQLKFYLEMTDWGYALLPALLITLLVPKQAWQASLAARWTRSIWFNVSSRNKKKTIWIYWSILLPLLMLTWRAVLHRYWSFASGWDLAIYSQACSHNLHSSLRDETTLLADHFEPILAVFVPLCRVMDAPIVLLSAQILAFAVGVCGIIFLARRASWSVPITFVIATLYIIFPGNRLTFFYDFHPIAFSAAVLPWIVLSLLEKRIVASILLSLLLATLKETSALTLAGIGIWFSWLNMPKSGQSRRGLAAGIALTFSGFVLFFLIMAVAFPFFRNGAESQYFAKYYGHLGSNLTDVLKTFVTNPLLIARTMFDPQKLIYLTKILLPFLFCIVFRPIYFVPVIPALLVNLLSSHPYLHSGRFHYEAEIYPWLFVCAILLSRDAVFLRRWSAVTKAFGCKSKSFRIAWIAVMLCFFSGKSISWYAGSYPTSHLQLTVRNKLMLLRREWTHEKVAAISALTPHLSNVNHLYLLERWRDANIVVIAYPEGKGSWLYSIDDIELTLVPNLTKDYELIFKEPLYPTFRIWRRKGI